MTVYDWLHLHVAGHVEAELVEILKATDATT